jgi:hypothetical protein
MTEYRTDLKEFVLDQIDFIETKLNEAVADAVSQKGAITEAVGVVPQLRERVWAEAEGLGSSCMLAFPELVDRDGVDWWDKFAVMEREKFLNEASALLGENGKLAVARSVFRSN